VKISIGRSAALLLLAAALAMVAGGCSVQPAGTPPGAASGSVDLLASPRPTATSIEASPFPIASESGATPGPTLSPGFPVMDGAQPAQLPDDTTVVARWRVPVVGSAAYDFYMRALPDAGYAIVGAYPAERAALIRFRGREGRIWQLLAELVGDRTQVTVQTDRP
jgi:hypothetical protein